MADTVKIKLDYPVTVDAREYKELTMRRCKVKDRRAAQKQEKPDAVEVTLIATLCEVPPNVIDELDSADYAKLTEKLAGFFGAPTST